MSNDHAAAATDECKLAGRGYLAYLANLTLFPLIGFIWQWWLWRSAKHAHYSFALASISQAVFGSVFAGTLLTIATALIVFFGSLHSPWTWVILILYFTTCHACLILLGVVGYARSSAGKSFKFLQPKSWWG